MVLFKITSIPKLSLIMAAIFFPMSSYSIAAEGEIKKPEFRKEKSRELFEKGLKDFNEEKYKKSLASFKKAKKGAADSESKKIVNQWMQASEGGMRLLILAKQAKLKMFRDSYFSAINLSRKYANTPIEEKFNKFIEEVSSSAIHVLETFDSKGKYSAKYGKKRIKADESDPSRVFKGKGCIEWEQTKDKKAIQLLIKKDVPKNWTRFEGVIFWIYNFKGISMELIARTPGKEKKQQNAHMAKYTPRSTGRWEKVFVPFSQFHKYGKASFSNIDAFQFQVRGLSHFKIRLDHVCLVRKDPGKGKAPTGNSKKQ